MSTSMTSVDGVVVVRKGGRVNIRVKEPAQIAAGSFSDAGKRSHPGTVVALLKLDQLLTGHPAARLTEPVMGQTRRFARSADPGCNERQRCVTQQDFHLFDNSHVAILYYVACYVSRRYDLA